MKRFLAVAACLILVGCEELNQKTVDGIIYVRDNNGIVYAKGIAFHRYNRGSGYKDAVFMTAIPESEVNKIPTDQIIDLPKPNR